MESVFLCFSTVEARRGRWLKQVRLCGTVWTQEGRCKGVVLVALVGEGESRWVDTEYFLQKVDGGWRKYFERKGLKVDVADVEDKVE